MVDVFNVDGQSTSYNITNLLPYELVRVEVTASTQIGESPSAANEIRTAQACVYNLASSPGSLVFNVSVHDLCNIENLGWAW